LDTIDLSNLNRQFLFRKSDIKKSKALVASAFAHQFNPGPGPSSSNESSGSGTNGSVIVDEGQGVNIKARHGNVKEQENDVDWMRGFDLVMSALDNMGMLGLTIFTVVPIRILISFLTVLHLLCLSWNY
jgi:ubiquitin-like 1-activating enzyme E1 B